MNKLLFVLSALWGGGLGVWLTSWYWAKYFRETDYKADEFVVSLGYKDQLIEYLEQGKFYDTAMPYLAAWHPANELRDEGQWQRVDEIISRAEAYWQSLPPEDRDFDRAKALYMRIHP